MPYSDFRFSHVNIHGRDIDEFLESICLNLKPEIHKLFCLFFAKKFFYNILCSHPYYETISQSKNNNTSHFNQFDLATLFLRVILGHRAELHIINGAIEFLASVCEPTCNLLFFKYILKHKSPKLYSLWDLRNLYYGLLFSFCLL